MRAFITGGNGFVGRHLRAHLEECGDEVTVFDLPGDITDEASLREALQRAEPDAIYHLAALAHVGSSWKSPQPVLHVNVVGTGVLLAAAHDVAPNARVLFVSSAEVYGVVTSDDLPVTELTTPRPASPYAASKLAGEVLVGQAVRSMGQDIVIARPFNHVGPGQAPTFFVPAMAARIIDAETNGLATVRVGNLSSRRDFTDVRDVVRAYRLLIEHGLRGEVYNVASGRDVAMAEAAEEIRNVCGSTVTFEVDPELVRPVDIPVLRGSAEKLNAATGWSPRYAWSQTLADIVAGARA